MEASFNGSCRDLVGAWYSNVLQTRLLLINLRVDKAFKSIVSLHLILLSFQQMMDKMLVASESSGLSSTDSNDSNNQGREGHGEEDEYRCHVGNHIQRASKIHDEQASEPLEGESEERASRVFKSYCIKTSLYYSIPCQLGIETHLIIDFYDHQ